MPPEELEEKISAEDNPPEQDPGDDKDGLIYMSDIHREEPEPKDEPPETKETKEKEPADKKEPDEAGRRQQHLENLNRAIKEAELKLHKVRQEKKETGGKKDEPAPLTDAQLLTIMDENKDDPKTLLQVMKYAAEQAAKKAKTETINETEIIARKKETDAALRGMFKDQWDNPSSEIRLAVDTVKSEFGIEDHPTADYFATAILALRELPDLQRKAYERGKAEAGKGNIEAGRRDKIKEGKIDAGRKPPSDKKGSSGLSPSQIDVARRLGYTTPEKLKRYAQIIGAQPGGEV